MLFKTFNECGLFLGSPCFFTAVIESITYGSHQLVLNTLDTALPEAQQGDPKITRITALAGNYPPLASAKKPMLKSYAMHRIYR